MEAAIYSPQSERIQLRGMDLGWHLGDVVRKLRDAKGWSQTQLGKKAGGMNKNTIVRLENDGPLAVDTKTIDRVARALGLSISDLYGLVPLGKDPPARPQANPFRDVEWIKTRDYEGPGRRRIPRERGREAAATDD